MVYVHYYTDEDCAGPPSCQEYFISLLDVNYSSRRMYTGSSNVMTLWNDFPYWETIHTVANHSQVGDNLSQWETISHGGTSRDVKTFCGVAFYNPTLIKLLLMDDWKLKFQEWKSFSILWNGFELTWLFYPMHVSSIWVCWQPIHVTSFVFDFLKLYLMCVRVRFVLGDFEILCDCTSVVMISYDSVTVWKYIELYCSVFVGLIFPDSPN